MMWLEIVVGTLGGALVSASVWWALNRFGRPAMNERPLSIRAQIATLESLLKETPENAGWTRMSTQARIDALREEEAAMTEHPLDEAIKCLRDEVASFWCCRRERWWELPEQIEWARDVRSMIHAIRCLEYDRSIDAKDHTPWETVREARLWSQNEVRAGRNL